MSAIASSEPQAQRLARQARPAQGVPLACRQEITGTTGKHLFMTSAAF